MLSSSVVFEGRAVWASRGTARWVDVKEVGEADVSITISGGVSTATMTIDQAEALANQLLDLVARAKSRTGQ